MYKVIKPFGVNVYGSTLGDSWLSLVQATLEKGISCSDEGRMRSAIHNVRLISQSQTLPDLLINKFGDLKNLESMLDLTFKREDMFDIDVVPSFSPRENKSYHFRIKQGRLIEFVVARLTEIPESKKAVIVFPTWDDYKAVLTSPRDDYLPCLVSIQFRLRPNKRGWILDTIFYARSIDAYQKSYANLWAIAQLSETVAKQVAKNRGEKITVGQLDGVIADAHIYQESFDQARSTIDKWAKSAPIKSPTK